MVRENNHSQVMVEILIKFWFSPFILTSLKTVRTTTVGKHDTCLTRQEIFPMPFQSFVTFFKIRNVPTFTVLLHMQLALLARR
jgi:hypothetical protein